MSLTTALNSSLSGLRATQAGIDVVSQNIANADSIGYTKRRLNPVQQVTGDRTTGVRTGQAERLLNQLVQRQLRLETSGASYTDTIAGTYKTVDTLFGQPGGVDALDTQVNAFTQSLQTLESDPSSPSSRTNVLNAASLLSNKLNSLSTDVQSLRGDAETAISSSVDQVNSLLGELQTVNTKLGGAGETSPAALLDDRDRIINDLSKFVDVKVTEGARGTVTLATTAGLQLFNGITPTRLEFDARPLAGPQALYDTDDTKRGVGTIKAVTGNGGGIDVIANSLIRSGSIAANIKLRDDTLVQAQNQLDELAAGLASSLSDRQISGTAASAGAANGFSIDVAPVQNGNTITLDTTLSGTAQRFSFVRVDDTSQLPLANSATADGSDRVYGIDFSGGYASVATQIQTALGSGFTVSNTGSSIRILDDGAANTTNVTALKENATTTGSTPDAPEYPVFTDGSSLYTGSFQGGSQLVGFAGRIGVNPALKTNPSALVVYPTTPPAAAVLPGDSTRPALLLDRLTNAERTFSATAGIGGVSAPYTSTVTDYARRVVETQGANAQSAKNIDEGQQTALSAVESRFSEESGVNVDEEIAQLVQLQNAYSANARVISAVRDLFDTLLRI